MKTIIRLEFQFVLGLIFFLGQIFATDYEAIRNLARKGQMDSAFRLSKQALELDSNDPKALFMLAKLSPEGKSSAEYFHRLLKISGQGQEAEESTFRLGQYYYATGKYFRSIPFFREYLVKFPLGDWQAPAHYWMGNACLAYAQSVAEKSSYLDSAFAYFQQLSFSQSSQEYYRPLALEGQARVQIAQGNRAGAIASIDSALKFAPEEERGALLLLAAQARQGANREEEKNFINQLVATYPESPEVQYLRKLNHEISQSAWKSGTGFPKALTVQGDFPAQAKNIDSVTRIGENPPRQKMDSADGKKFTLQLGAFSQSSNAKSMVANLSKLGFTPELVENQRNGKPIFQVRIGRFATPEEASAFAVQYLKPHQLLSQPVPLIQ